MIKKPMKRNLWMVAALAAGVVAAGCGGDDDSTPVPTTTAVAPPPPEFRPDVDAGVPVTPVNDPALISKLAASKLFISRSDPFALLSNERAFEVSQEAERLLASAGGWTVEYVPPPDPTGAEEQEVMEPQPYRRLSGIIVGDTVMAIVEMEDGTHIVRPGMRIPNTEWRVISIDEEKAILRRGGNRRPTQVIVRLESPPAGMGGAAAPGRGNQGGAPGGNPFGGGGAPRGGRQMPGAPGGPGAPAAPPGF